MTPEASPLAEIEARVQRRAADETLDLDDAASHAALAELIDDEIDRWADDHRRGLRPDPLPDPDRVAQRALRNLTGYGPLEPLLG